MQAGEESLHPQICPEAWRPTILHQNRAAPARVQGLGRLIIEKRIGYLEVEEFINSLLCQATVILFNPMEEARVVPEPSGIFPKLLISWGERTCKHPCHGEVLRFD